MDWLLVKRETKKPTLSLFQHCHRRRGEKSLAHSLSCTLSSILVNIIHVLKRTEPYPRGFKQPTPWSVRGSSNSLSYHQSAPAPPRRHPHPTISSLRSIDRPWPHNPTLCPLLWYSENMSAEEVANAFVAHYYQARDSNPASLAALFVSSCLVVW